MQVFFIILLSCISYIWIDRPAAELFSIFSLHSLKVITHITAPFLHLFVWGGAFILSYAFKLIEKHRTHFMSLFSLVTINMFVSGVLKLATTRARPSLLLENGVFGFFLANSGDLYRSFPSSHSAIAITLYMYLSRLFPSRHSLFLFSALLLSFLRAVTLEHYISDVLFGIAQALLMGKIFFIVLKQWESARNV